MSQASYADGEGLRPSLNELLALEIDAVNPAMARGGRGNARQGGAFRMRLHGQGLEPSDSRPYVAGDEARHVDWRLTARAGQMYSKRFEAERARVCLLLADVDARQFFGTRVRYKSVQAARVIAAAAWWAQRKGDRTGALNCASGALLPPRGGRAGVLPLLDALQRWYGQPPSGEVLPVPLQRQLDVALRLARGGTLVVVAEAARVAEVPAAWWALLAAHLQVHLVLVSDRIEDDPPAQTLTVVTAAGRQRLALDDAHVREAWTAARRQALTTIMGWQFPGLSVHSLYTDDSASGWLPVAHKGVPR